MRVGSSSISTSPKAVVTVTGKAPEELPPPEEESASSSEPQPVTTRAAAARTAAPRRSGRAGMENSFEGQVRLT
jgi:hypothetical protein